MNQTKYCSQIKAWSKKLTDNLKIWPPFQNLRQSCMQSALNNWMKHTREQCSKKKFKCMHRANNWRWGDETSNEPEKRVKQSRCAKFLHNFHVFASENVWKTLILLNQSYQTLRLEQKAHHWHSNRARGLKGNIIKHSTPSKIQFRNCNLPGFNWTDWGKEQALGSLSGRVEIRAVRLPVLLIECFLGSDWDKLVRTWCIITLKLQ